MKIEGSIRSNLISAITSVRRWQGRPVHKDTLNYWHAALDHGRRVETAPWASLWPIWSRNSKLSWPWSVKTGQ